MEGDGNAALTLNQARVLLEIIVHRNSSSISHSYSKLYDLKWWELCFFRPSVHSKQLERNRVYWIVIELNLIRRFTCSESQ